MEELTRLIKSQVNEAIQQEMDSNVASLADAAAYAAQNDFNSTHNADALTKMDAARNSQPAHITQYLKDHLESTKLLFIEEYEKMGMNYTRMGSYVLDFDCVKKFDTNGFVLRGKGYEAGLPQKTVGEIKYSISNNQFYKVMYPNGSPRTKSLRINPNGQSNISHLIDLFTEYLDALNTHITNINAGAKPKVIKPHTPQYKRRN